MDEIETRATIIRTYDGRRVVIPNSTLFTEALSVNTAFDHLRSEYEVHVKPGEDVEQMRQDLWMRFKMFPTFCTIRRQRHW